MSFFIIIEGNEGSGKTSLANKLARDNPSVEIVHFDKPKNDKEAFGYWKIYLEKIRECRNHLTIFDRCWYSDRVYGPIMRNREEMSLEHMYLLELAVKNHGGGIIYYCCGTQEVLWKRASLRGEKYVNAEQHILLHQKYEEVMEEPAFLPVVRVDTTRNFF